MNGTLSLASLSSPSFNCSAIINQIKSSSSMRTLESVYASGQIHCESDYTDIDSSWLTRYTQVRFSGNLYISIIVHDGVCAGPPVLLTRDSTCDFQVKGEENMNNTGKCDWTLENSVHHMGDQDPNQSGGDGE
uniref:Secreted protein n=1 Tax=Phakopsora pachyrhizi TaxID=170000 RepID=A0A0S1MIR5_PHAPC